jgi:hypothetical protein
MLTTRFIVIDDDSWIEACAQAVAGDEIVIMPPCVLGPEVVDVKPARNVVVTIPTPPPPVLLYGCEEDA